MSVEDGSKLILKAYEKRLEERSFQLYVSKYPWMSEEDFISFEEFYQPARSRGAVKNNQNANEILKDVSDMMNEFSFERRR